MADGGYAAKNGAASAPVHKFKGDGATFGVRVAIVLLVWIVAFVCGCCLSLCHVVAGLFTQNF
jgi:hypothetical protein